MFLRGRFIFVVFILTVCRFSTLTAGEPPFLKYKTDRWVIEQVHTMSLKEKIAQMMIITVYPGQSAEAKNKLTEQIKTLHPGGILIMQGDPVNTASWINDFQEISRIPLLVAVDGEWGLGMRTDSVMKFPYAQAIGAVQDSNIIYQMGKDIAAQLKLAGIRMNFAPVVDINTNPANPVINFRSFGEDRLNVAQKAWLISKGMQDNGVVAVAKHFPGHGDTDTDSHKALPFLSHSKERIDTLESFPFRYLSERGITGIMTAHLNVPSLDDSGTPSSISKKIVAGYLREEIGFKGLVITDAINMKGVRTQEGNTELAALRAGNDMVEFVPDLQKAIQSVEKAVEEGKITVDEINEKCTTILEIKRWLELNQYKPVDLKNITKKLNSPEFEVTNRKVIKGTLTVLKNDSILPVQKLDSFKIASVNIGGSSISPFQQMLDKYTKVDHFALSKVAQPQNWEEIRNKLKNYNLVIFGVQGINLYPGGKYGVSDLQLKAVKEIVSGHNSIGVFFGNAYALKYFENIHEAKALIMAYQNTDLAQELTAQLVFGAIGATGKLPVTIDSRFKVKDGMEIQKDECLAYTIPEEMGVNSKPLERKVDSLANLGIKKNAFPGCQVLIAKDGNVIFHKTYGYHTYEKKISVKEEDLYDWASITKVTGPLPALMKLVDEQKIDVEKPLSDYWDDFKNCNKEGIRISEFLTHQAGLQAWIPFWQLGATKKGELKPDFFKTEPEEGYRIRISHNLYEKDDFPKMVYDSIRNSKLGNKKYVYSDLAFIIFPEVITRLTGENYEQYLKQNFYSPLGASTVTYNPYNHFNLDRIIPTETDAIFRKENIQGFVHDESAAVLGGVSGNAGLFGTTNDLAKIFQMYLQKGYYGGKRYISEKTIENFTKTRFPENDNRRALGFDKPFPVNKIITLRSGYPALDVSQNSYGHSGFTGTFVWVDPDIGLLYIFMSNRIYPTRENSKIFDLNIRSEILQSICECFKSGLN